MTLITVEERLIIPAGHHRQPRTAQSWVQIQDPQNPDQPVNNYTPGSTFNHHFSAGFNDGTADVVFAFASASDQLAGSVYTNPTVSVPVGGQPMTVVAWYLPPGGVGGTGTDVFVDAFSEKRGDFVDDTFVTVTGDPTLTTEANVVGDLPTKLAETLVAAGMVASTNEVFDRWIGQDPEGTTDLVAASASGIAIAMYHPAGSPPALNKPSFTAEEIIYIISGVINDAPGIGYRPGGGIGPIDPGWGSLVQRVSSAAGLVALSGSTRGSAEITRLAIAEVNAAVKQFDAHVGSARISG